MRPRPWLLIIALLGAAAAHAQQPPIPVGLDAYLHWDRWPQQRIGMRAYMRSTYDRAGGNEGADASHFLYEENGLYYPLDIAGPGQLVFARFNHWHGSPWTFEVDHKPYQVRESSTSDPNNPIAQSVFEPQGAFPKPLAFTWSTTHGADLSWVPMGFRRSLRLGYGRTHYGTGYYIFDRFVPDIPLSQPILPWNPASKPSQAVSRLLSQSGEDITGLADVRAETGQVDISPKASKQLWKVAGPATVRLIELETSASQAEALEGSTIMLRWDGRRQPSVWSPIPLFFGAGTLFNRNGSRWLVKAFPVSIQQTDGRILLRCLFPMPFFRSAELSVQAGAAPIRGLTWRVKELPFKGDPHTVGYFHATYRDQGPSPPLGKDLLLLDTDGEEGSHDWSGSFIGTSMIFSDTADLGTLEGDPRFFFDDSLTPQAQGTGTEEWCGGGDYWGGNTMTLPFVGHPTGAPSRDTVLNARDNVESAYRFLLADLMPFGRRAVIRLEHGGLNESQEHYRTLAYWYGLPSASLIKTDQLDIGSLPSERSHIYKVSGPFSIYDLDSRYEWGPDTFNGKTIYPTTRAKVRAIQGFSEFNLAINPHNLGVLLRRKLDYAFSNQRAEVFVGSPTGARNWRKAGTWYLAGSNTCLYSNPPDELGAPNPTIETSNRRFRDDEFLVAKSLTKGKSKIRVRIVFLSQPRPLQTGEPPPQTAWTEIRYTAYNFVVPDFVVPGR